MDIVVDANILFSALIKEGATSELLFADDLRLFAPEFIFVEFSKHKESILGKTQRSEGDFSRLIEILSRRISLIPFSEFQSFAEEADKISPDPDDAQYFALALKLHCPIWSNDKPLTKQSKIRVLSTDELLKLLR
jgi:predicted nucleic acid-binding protein